MKSYYLRHLKCAALAAVLGLAVAAPTKASVLYTYTGNPFNAFQDSEPPTGTYDTTMSVNGSFEVAAPLVSLPSLTDIRAQILSYSFSDGRNTLDDGNSRLAAAFFTTDAAGTPLQWDFAVVTDIRPPVAIGDQFPSIRTTNTTIIFDIGQIFECTAVSPTAFCEDFNLDRGSTVLNPVAGSWVVSGRPIPEPSTTLLFGAGLAGLGLMRRRKLAA